MRTNSIDTLGVYACYATGVAKDRIKDKFNGCSHIKEINVDSMQILSPISDELMNFLQKTAQELWPNSHVQSNIYPIIRKYNMPKKNYFPEITLTDPRRFICLFVKRAEIG